MIKAQAGLVIKHIKVSIDKSKCFKRINEIYYSTEKITYAHTEMGKMRDSSREPSVLDEVNFVNGELTFNQSGKFNNKLGHMTPPES